MKVALITPDRAYHPFVAMIVEGLRARGDEIFASDPGNGVAPHEVVTGPVWIMRALAEAQAVLVFFGKSGSLAAGEPPTREPRYDLLELADEAGVVKCPTAYLDYSEMTSTGRDNPGQIAAMKKHPWARRGDPWINMWAFDHCDHYFKRECFPEDRAAAGVRPIAFGMLESYDVEVPRYGKDWDMFCCFGHKATGLRKEVVEEVLRLKGKWRTHSIQIRERLNAREYQESLARSKIVIDAWGHGDHCYRLWEGLGAKACMLYQRYQVLTGPDWLVEGREAVSFSTMKEFTQKAEALLESREETMAIGRRGYEKARLAHTGKARVDYIFSKMGLSDRA